jgi:pSer/pThr/pTyr-binding forkhead associated (FHA) protein
MPDPAQASPWTDSQPTQAPSANPMLVVVSSGALHGQTLVLDGPEWTVGRAADNDLRLDDLYTSRHHAVLRRAGSAVLIEDAGSSAGVYVNGHRIDGPALLRPGDVIRLGRIDLQLHAEGRAAAQPPSSGAAAAGSDPASSGNVRFALDSQRAHLINNVGRDQINKNEYALKFAPLRRRARALIQIGVGLMFGGFAVGLLGMVRYLSVFQEWINLLSSPGVVSPEQAGEVFQRLMSSAFPFFITGAAMILGGVVCIVTGLLMRRRAREARR